MPVRRVVTLVCAVALGLPAGAAAQETVLNVSIVGLTLPMTLSGSPATYVTPGSYTFSLTDRAPIHSIHVRGPLDTYGEAGPPVNFGTASPDGTNVAFTSFDPLVFANVPLDNGRYRWFCDLHSDMMHGSLMVGNYLSVKVEGQGYVTSSAGSMSCVSECGLGVPDDAAPITLTATPQAGHAFQRWEGPCSGDGPCTVTVTGLVETKAIFRELPKPPPPPPELAPGTVKQVKAAVTKRKRVVTVTLDLTAASAASAQLRVGGKVVATSSAMLAAGRRKLQLQVPKKTKAGPATVRITLKRTGSTKSFVSTRPVRLPKV